jgi:hypothetical protein
MNEQPCKQNVHTHTNKQRKGDKRVENEEANAINESEK